MTNTEYIITHKFDDNGENLCVFSMWGFSQGCKHAHNVLMIVVEWSKWWFLNLRSLYSHSQYLGCVYRRDSPSNRRFKSPISLPVTHPLPSINATGI